MPRFHATDKGNIPFTPEEEAQRDREEAAAILQQAEAKKAAATAVVKDEMAAADLSIIRALAEWDTARIKEHNRAQAQRRAKLK